MAEITIDTSVLNGKRLYYSFLAGAQRLFENQSLLNSINVFPVRDADTGTNLASTLRSVVDTFIPTDNIKVTFSAIADAALVGARGNSGIIFAQFLYGISNEIKGDDNITVKEFATALKNAFKYAYDSIANPVEGTIITVMREWVEYIYLLKDYIDDFNKLIIESYKKAMEALLDTPKKLEILAKANVVDAGAKGFVFFLEGMIDFFKSGELKTIVKARNAVKALFTDTSVISHEDITFRFCSEALIIGEKINKEKIKRSVEPYGDSLVIAGSSQKVRMHIHTDQPEIVFSRLAKYGSITYQKVDDMVMQNEIAEHRKWPIAIMTDSTCDLPEDVLEKYQIHVVPLSVHFGDSYFLDRVTIKPSVFYDMIDRSKVYPSTAQPSYKDFINKYSYLGSMYNSIIALHLSKELSGTFSNSFKASVSVSKQIETRIDVVNSRRLSSGLGLVVLRAAHALEAGMSHDELLSKINEWNDKNKMLVTAKTIKYMVKSGRVPAFKGAIGKLLGVKPVVKVNDIGKTELFGKPFTEKASMKLVMKQVTKMLENGKLWGYAISHAKNESSANWFAEEIEKLTGLKPAFISATSPVLGAHVGPGVVGLSLMFE